MPRKDSTENLVLVPDPTVDDLPRFRELLDVTQGQFADLIGVTRATVNRWEQRVSEPRQGELEKAAQVTADLMKSRVFELPAARKAVNRLNTKLGKQHPRQKEAIERVLLGVEQRVELVSRLAIGEEGTEMPDAWWALLLVVNVEIFADVPPTRLISGARLLLGLDVGVAMDASLRGRTYLEWASMLGGVRSVDYAGAGELQLSAQSVRVVHEIAAAVESLPTTAEEWHALEMIDIYEADRSVGTE